MEEQLIGAASQGNYDEAAQLLKDGTSVGPHGAAGWLDTPSQGHAQGPSAHC
eukprot:m.248468 g.248468  ORF g.248468 m.248468 type:complete len:52 (-) comp10972_c2_seq2:23-178(-)